MEFTRNVAGTSLGINAYHGDAAGGGPAHRLHIEGKVADLDSPILHDDRKPLSRWFEAQPRYTKLEASKLLAADPRTLTWTDRIRCWRFVAPLAVLFYCLIIRGGILDGRAGFYYAFQRLLAELMLSLYLIEEWIQPHKSTEKDQSISQSQLKAQYPGINQPRINADNADQTISQI